MTTRVLAAYFKLAPYTNPGFGIPPSQIAPHTMINARDPASAPNLMQGAIEGHVLVKNVKKALPLRNPRFISLFGYDGPAEPRVNPPYASVWNHGFDDTTILINQTRNISVGIFQYPDIGIKGTMWTGGGSGASTPPYLSDPFQAFQIAAQKNGAYLAWDFESAAPQVEGASELCVVFINAFSAEGNDRRVLADTYSDNLVNSVASQCPNTMVVIHNAGIRLVDGFYDNENITAIIYAHLPGQDSGAALVQLMYGQQSFSGRLPYTIAKQASDYGSLLEPVLPDATSDYYTQLNFTEGIYIDYKSFIKNDITPRFPFGHGLTYTNFRYSNIAVNIASGAANLTALPAQAPIMQGGNPRLFDNVATVTATITNTGRVTAAEVAQLYVGIPGGPPKQLRGFVKTTIQPGQGTQVSFTVTRRDLSRWDVVAQEWRLQSGTYRFHVGKSVLDIVGSMSLSLTTV